MEHVRRTRNGATCGHRVDIGGDGEYSRVRFVGRALALQLWLRGLLPLRLPISLRGGEGGVEVVPSQLRPPGTLEGPRVGHGSNVNESEPSVDSDGGGEDTRVRFIGQALVLHKFRFRGLLRVRLPISLRGGGGGTEGVL